MKKKKLLHFALLTYFFAFELLTRGSKVKSLTSSYWLDGCNFVFSISITNVKLINQKNYLIIAVSTWHRLTHSITSFVFSLHCRKFICDIYLSMLDFNGLWKFNHIFINKITTCRSYNFNGRQNRTFSYEMVDRLTELRLMLWNVWSWC